MARQYKLARKMKKIALTAAAKELGVSQPTLSSWESERKAPSIEGLIRMSEYYHVSTDVLLGLTTESDPRKDWIEPVDPSVLPALHETPVYVPEKGWAFVDAVEKCLRFADGSVVQNEAVKEVFIIPPAYALRRHRNRNRFLKISYRSMMRYGSNLFNGSCPSGGIAWMVPYERAICRE